MNLLRKAIRQLIVEGIRSEELKNLALYRGRYGENWVIYLLFNPSLLDDILNMKDNLSLKNLAYSDNIYGMIRAKTSWAEKPPIECSGAWELDRAAAKKGWGPTMYDIAMGDSPNGVMSDRMSVSNKASPIWKFYYNNRKDVSKAPLDYYAYQWTPNTDDDCSWGGGGINYSRSSGWNETASNSLLKLGKDRIADDKQLRHEDFINDPMNWVYNKGRINNRPAAIKKFKLINRMLRYEMPEFTLKHWGRLAMAYFAINYFEEDDDGV